MLKKLIDRPIAVTMTLIMVMVLGMASLRLLPVSLIPPVDVPYITVKVAYPEQSARELEESVISPLRQQLMQIAGLQDITSETKDGNGTISLSFEHGAKSDFLFIEVNEKIDRAMAGMPKDMERPQVLKAGVGDIPAFYINMTAADDDSKFKSTDPLHPVSERFAQLSDFAGNVIVKRIEQLPEVAMVDVSGYVWQEILVIPDRAKLTQMGLTAAALESAIKNTNISLGNLTVRDGEYQFNIKVQRSARGVQDIENAWLKIDGRIFQIKELAQVMEHPRPLATIVRSDGKNALSLAIIKQSDARMSRLRKSVNELLSDFKTDYPNVEFTVTRDQTALLDYSINNLFQNIALGVLLACLIIFLFMQNLRSAFLIALTMPIALVLSMLFFYLIGISINIISLSGLVLGVGMMVDNSIIVIDNITFRWGQKMPLKDAIVKGTGEVFAPMLSSVLTTCAVFVPLIFLSGIAGALFYDQAMAVVITLFSSLAATVTVIPVYFYLIYRKKSKITTNKYLSKISFGWFERWYERTLKFFFRRRWIIWSSFITAIFGMVALFAIIRKDRLPEMTYRDILVHVNWNERITIGENDRRVGLLTAGLRPLADQITEMTGPQQFVLPHTEQTGNSESIIYVNCAKNHTIDDVKKTTSEFLKNYYPHAIYSFEASGNIFEEVFAERQARLVVRLRQTDGQAPDPAKLDSVLAKIRAAVPEADLSPIEWEEYIVFIGKPDVMALYDVSLAELSGAMRASLNDNAIFTMMQGKFSVPVVVGDNRATLSEIMSDVTVRRGNLDIPISTFFREGKGQDLKYITSGSEGNFYPLELNIKDREIPETVAAIRETIRENADFEVGFSGAYYDSQGMAWEILIVLIVAVLLLYFILAAQFESAVQPVVILSELILDIFFTLLVLWALNISLNIMSLIGIIVTCGIVINDSILKVDTINQLRKYEGMGIIRAIMEGGRRRLKPIVMTSLTTIFAIAPFLIRGDMGSDLQYPLSVATIAGMTAGTLVSIFFVPLIYYAIYAKKRK